MIRPSKGVEVLLIVFGVVFLAAWVFFAGSFSFSAPENIQGNRWVGVLFSAVFILVGRGIIYAVIGGRPHVKGAGGSPAGQSRFSVAMAKGLGGASAESKTRNSAIGLWTAAIFVNSIAFTVSGFTVPQLWRNSNLLVLLPPIFSVVGTNLAVAAIRASLRRKRFGHTYFEFASLPFSPGGSLNSTIHLRFDAEAQTWH